MKRGLLPAAPGEPLQVGHVGATRDTPSAIRLLGTDKSGGTTSASRGATTKPDTPAVADASAADLSEVRAGLSMDPIDDDDWDIEQPAATNVPAVSSAPARPATVTSSAALPATSPSQAPSAGRFASPLGIAPPAATKPVTMPPPAAAPAPAVVAPVQKVAAAASQPVSKVQLAAEAFRRKAGINATPSAVPSKPAASAAVKRTVVSKSAAVAAGAPGVKNPVTSASADAVTTQAAARPEPQQSAVIASPVVSLEEPLELLELSQSVPPPPIPEEAPVVASVPPPPIPEEAPAVASMPPPPIPEEAFAATSIQPSPVVDLPADLETPDAKQEAPEQEARTAALPVQPAVELPKAEAPKAEAPKAEAPKAEAPKAEATDPAKPTAVETKRESSSKLATKAKAGPARVMQESHLSLETDYAVEFFSSPPPPVHFEAAIEHDLVLHETRHVRTPELIARQQYLRRLVLKVMLVAVVFVAVTVFVLWHRGLLRFTL